MSGALVLTSIGIGVCFAHRNPIPMVGMTSSGSFNISISGFPSARILDIVLGGCGHIGLIVSGSSKVKANNRGKSTIGSTFVGAFNGILVTGVPAVQVGG